MATLLLATVAVASPALCDPPTLPNIVIILTDDMGYGDIGCYGSRAIKTPNIDALAQAGVRLTNFYSSASVCSASRAGLLTGRYPVRTGALDVFYPVENPLNVIVHAFLGTDSGMNTNEVTLAQVLSDSGYATACIGKWHLGGLPKHRPHNRGFDRFFGLLYSNDMTPAHLYRDDTILEQHPIDQSQLTPRYTEEAVRFIDDNAGEPFFLYLAHSFPHIPLHPSGAFHGTSAGGLYGDTVEEIDWSTGQIVAALERNGIADNTLVFFTSDNGPWFQGSPGGLRNRKGSAFDGGFGVPAIACWPGVIPAGTEVHEPAMNLDLFTTAVAMAGATLPNDRAIDGRDILPMLKGEAASPHEALMFYDGRNVYAIRMGKWKYHLKHKGWTADVAFANNGPYLFDLSKDPDESYNVLDRHPSVVADIRSYLNGWSAGFRRNVVSDQRNR